MILQNQFRFIRNRWHPLWRLRKLPLYRYIQRKIDFTVFTRLPKVKDRVAVKFLRDLSWIVNPSSLEPEINNTFKVVLNLMNPKVFWDIGANIGFYSWYVRQYPSIQNIALFEPDPINFSLLQKTILKNKIANCKVLNVAVSDRVGEVTFLIDQVSGATGSIEATSHVNNKHSLHSHYNMSKTITCRTVSIDSIVFNMPLPDFIKIDVEGAEHLVIAGAKAYIDQYKPTLIIETTNISLIHQLHNDGYTVFKIDEGNLLFVSNKLQSISKEINNVLPLFNLEVLN